MRHLRRAAVQLPSIDDELRSPNPDAYMSKLARMLAQWAANDDNEERARGRLELAHKYEASRREETR